MRYMITEKDGRTQYAVEGELVGDFLAVHEEPGGTMEADGSTWSIDHRPTGGSISETNHKEDALRVARELDGLVDWDFSDPAEVEARIPEDVKEYARHVRDSIYRPLSFEEWKKEHTA